MPEEGWPSQPGGDKGGPSAGFVVTQVLLAVVAVLVFLWLINILVAYDGDPALPAMVDWMGRDAWIGTTLVLLGVILLVEILLLRPATRRAVMDVKAWRAQHHAVADTWEDDPVQHAHAPEHLIGCPACGTVFDAAANGTDTHGTFACPNCGRTGRVRTREPVPAHLHDIACPRCHTQYQAYQQESECPSCGQHVRVRRAG